MSKTIRQHTRAIVVVHSHKSKEAIDLSNDVIRISTSKSVKGIGTCQLTLVPRQNYLNRVYPNDIINVYFDPGDGKSGFVRSFMGYVDRVERESQVDSATGGMRTFFNISCSDFAKAIEKTDIYLNPADRFPIDPRFITNATGDSGGLALTGIRVNGTPADIVENVLQLLLGFGQQWNLPKSYPPAFIQQNRLRRRQQLKAKLPTNLLTALEALGLTNPDDFNTIVNNIFTKAQVNTGTVGATIAENQTKDTSSGTGIPIPDINLYVASLYQSLQQDLASVLDGEANLLAYNNAIKTTTDAYPAGIVDLLDMSFIETMCIDGYVANSSIWTESGSLIQFLFGHAHENVNELMFDLRPVTSGDGGDRVFGNAYATSPDELGINVNGYGDFKAGVSAVQYVPAVIMREYPYSVVEGLDLSNFGLNIESDEETSTRIGLAGAAGNAGLGKFSPPNSNVGILAFGPVFAMEPNIPGRKVYSYEDHSFAPLIPERCLFAANSKALKHLDVVVIENADIIAVSVGRSDEDVFNLFEISVTGAGSSAEDWRFFVSEFSPVINPISLQRDGLRTRKLTTEFANYSRDPSCTANDNSSAVDNFAIRRNLARWTIMLDHWYQHNNEFLTGTFSLGARPDIRVGYRMDWKDQHESYYVEQVSQNWDYPNSLMTTVQVSRGQRNDPFPAYIPPVFAVRNGKDVDVKHSGNRWQDGRLAQTFDIMDTNATKNAVGRQPQDASENENTIDKPPFAGHGGRVQYAGAGLAADSAHPAGASVVLSNVVKPTE